MRKYFVLSIIFSLINFLGYCQKVNSPVLKKELIGKYDGVLKNGLANGTGTAIGSETFTGEFKKGLPDGDGVYTDSLGNIFKGTFRLGVKNGPGVYTPVNGSTEQTIIGYWKDDKYIGKELLDPFKISNMTGSVIPRIFCSGPGNKVEISVIDPVNNGYLEASIFLIGQAITQISYGRYLYDDVIFPVEFDIQYNCTNKYRVGNINNTIRIKINNPGTWIIKLKN